MADVHQLIFDFGIEEARRQATTKHERQVVEAAYQVLIEDSEKTGFTYSGFALTSLPHKLVAERDWRRDAHGIVLLVQSGLDREGRPVGLPYGSYARFILLFLQSEAVRTGSREVLLGRSMESWLGRMGVAGGGKTRKLVNEQARRISLCSLTFYADHGNRELMRRGAFIDGTISMTDLNLNEPPNWQERVLLNEEFFRALQQHPVPLSETALRAIGPRSMVIDTYIWLAYRLHALKCDIEVSWTALYAQFGAGYGSRLRNFRAHFVEVLRLALAAYPDARVSLGERGIVLRPSRPAIAKV
jgi:Plasmid encoded RepA protein